MELLSFRFTLSQYRDCKHHAKSLQFYTLLGQLHTLHGIVTGVTVWIKTYHRKSLVWLSHAVCVGT